MLLCLDYGGSSIKFGLLDPAFMSLVSKGSVPNTFTDQAAFLDATYGLIDRLLDENTVSGIAISYCGELDHVQGLIHSPGSYMYNGGLNLRQVLEEKYHLPVSIENDGNAAMLAEWYYGVLQGYENAGMIVLGTGIAGSFVLDGHLHTGKLGFSGILSLLPSTFAGTSFGFESSAIMFAASSYLIREYLIRTHRPLPENLWLAKYMLDDQPFDGKKFFELYHAGDSIAASILQDFAGNVAKLLFGIHAVLEIEAFAIGGGISGQPVLIEEIQNALDKAFSDPLMRAIHFPKPKVLAAGYGADANLIGAALWHQELFK